MGKIRRRVKSESGFGAVALALMNDGKPYDVPLPKKGGGNAALKPDQGKGVFAQVVANSHTETTPKLSLVVTRMMSPGDVEAFGRFSSTAR